MIDEETNRNPNNYCFRRGAPKTNKDFSLFQFFAESFMSTSSSLSWIHSRQKSEQAYIRYRSIVLTGLCCVHFLLYLFFIIRSTRMSIWKEPSSKNAFVLSWVSVLLEVIAIVAGIGLFLVSLIVNLSVNSTFLMTHPFAIATSLYSCTSISWFEILVT